MTLRVCPSIVGRGAALALALLTCASAHAQLVPPPGPVAPSMKRLDQLDARKLVTRLPGSSSAVHVISEPGQYMLDRDIDCPSGKSCIVVSACGPVSIDLNGFSLHGSSGALDGVSCPGSCPGGGGGGGAGGSLQVFSSKKGYDYYQARSSISGFSRAIATGDLDGDGLEDVVVAGISVESCVQGIVHLHAQNIVHRDLACRSISGGDAISVQFDESSSVPGGPRQSTSIDSARVIVDRATGRGMHVVSSTGTRITITGSDFGNTGAQGLHVAASSGVLLTVRGSSFHDTGSHGLHVARLGNPLITEVLAPKLDMSDSSARGCGGAGVRMEGSSGLATGKRQHGAIRSCDFSGCAVGIEATDCDDLEFDSLSISDVSSGGITARRAGRTKFSNITLKRGVVSSAALVFEDCDDVECVRVAVGDVNGDGVSCTRSSGSGGGAGKATFKEFSIVSPRDPASGQATGKRGMVFSGLSSVECVGVTIADVDGDGVFCASVGGGAGKGKATFKEFTITKKTDAASTLSHGLHLTDCDDVSCDRVSISGCPGDGIRHVSTVTALPTRGMLYDHHDLSISRCGGAGVRVVCPDQPSSSSITFSSSSMTRCGGDGVVVLCPSAQCSVELTALHVQARDCFGNGMRVSANPLSHVSVSMESSQCTGNGADGLSVRSSTQGTSLRGGGQVRCSTTHFRSNGGSGCVSENPLYADSSSFSENVLYGARVVSDDPFKQIASLDDCVLSRNGAACLSCPRGRFATADCRISDGLSHGIESSEGCALLTNTLVERCAGSGIVVSSSTLYLHGGAVRRNGSTGISASGGASFHARDLTVELNGSTSPPGTTGGGIYISDQQTFCIEKCTISQNTGEGVTVNASISSSISITDCKVLSNSGGGIAVGGQCTATVERCESSSNGGTGISLASSVSRGRVCSCVCRDNFAGGLRVLGTRNVIQSNSATGSAIAQAFEIAQGNAACPVVDPSSGVPACGATDNVVH